MNNNNFFFTILILFFIGCSPWKKKFISEGDYETAINNAIIDFINTNNSIEEFNTFHIIMDSNQDIIGISIIGDTNKWLLGNKKIGDTVEYFPTKYKEIEDNLFYWNDSTKVLDKNMIDILNKYEILDNKQYPNYMIPDGGGYSSQSGAVHYYFCKSNYLKYKKIKSTVSIGYYDPPKLNCNSK